jgi:hypothetical protein
MRKLHTFLVALGLLLIHMTTQAQTCQGTLSLDEFKAQVSDVQARYFPQLSETQIVVTTFKAEDYFLQAQPAKSTLVGSRDKRRYEVQLNLKLLECSPGGEALEAILIHELEHIVDYTQMSSAQILSFGLRYVTDRKFRTRYERQTDLKALKHKVHGGLMTYREWVYQWLTPKQLARKKQYYLSPDEILELE